MTWGRIDDSFYDHPKVEALPAGTRNSCVGLFVRAISWSNRHSTNGWIPTDRLRKLDGRPAMVTALLAVRLFETAEGGVQIHDFLDFNVSAEEVAERRAKAAEKKRRQRAGEQSPPPSPGDDHGDYGSMSPGDNRWDA